MSFLTNKYGLPPETEKRLIKDGIISSKWMGYEEVHRLWKEGKDVMDISIMTGRSQSSVYTIIREVLQKKV